VLQTDEQRVSQFQQLVTSSECMLTERQISENIFNSGRACYQHLPSSRLLSNHITDSIYKLPSLSCKQTSVSSEKNIPQN